jgi:Dyp-type peroxidase family
MAAPVVNHELDLADVQGIIVSGYKSLPCSKSVFLRIEDPAGAKRWLQERLPSITRGDQKDQKTVLNVGFTYLGLKRMGLGRAVHSFPREFREGMANDARSQQLGDIENSWPASWQVGGWNTREVHILLLIYGESKIATDAAYEKLVGDYLPSVFTYIYVQDAARNYVQDAARNPHDMREPFGFRDGLSQPAIEDIHRKAPKGQNLIKLGEFLLGYQDEYGYVPPSPAIPAYYDRDSLFPFLKDPSKKDFGRNGSYLVWRKIAQDVQGFNCFLKTQAEKTMQNEEWVAAKLMGRWRDGSPLVLAPERGDIPEKQKRDNGFLYSKDPQGLSCPITAHIRRANPRDSAGKASKRHLADRHRIIRRGMPFKDQDEEGLLFIGINADIARQFEFIQQSWLNHPQFGGMFNDRDLIASVNQKEKNGEMDLRGTSLQRKIVRLRLTPPQKPLVQIRGGGYFFLPSLTALKFLASENRGESVRSYRRIEIVEEHPLQNEAEHIKEIIAQVTQFMASHYPTGVRPAFRQAHAKAHGVVKAEFHVESELSDDTRFGVFQPGATYDAWVRFSNSDSTPQDDRKGGVRGMAIKLMGIHGNKLLQDETDATTQDFLLVNCPIFFSPDVADFLAFIQSTVRFGDMLGPLVYALGQPFTRLPNLVRMMRRTSTVTNVLTASYWSVSPYRLGKSAVKYATRPWDHDRSWRTGSSPNFLAETMAEYLAKYEARFDFMVQFQADSKKMPIEDSTVEWSESDSPFIKVATIRIPRQEFSSDAQRKFGENLSFTPWHSLSEHQPIGSMNRIRQATYQAMSDLRHKMNQVPKQEPR